jgi:3-oxoacyl-[acyl-carrier protein] reductase
MDLGLKGKVAVVLAASSGIGRGIATVLAQEGCSLAICARDSSRLNTVAEEIRSSTKADVFAHQCDVSNSASLDGFFDSVINRYGRIEILINNSGGPPAGQCFDFSDTNYDEAFNLVLMSKVRACRRCVCFSCTRARRRRSCGCRGEEKARIGREQALLSGGN